MRFAFIRSDFGIDTSRSPATMVIPVGPRGGDNFILVEDAGSVQMAPDSKKITVRQILDAKELDREISRIRFYGVSHGNSAVRKLIEFLSGVFSSLAQPRAKLFKISASDGGYSEITVLEKGQKTPLKLAVYMVRQQEFSVDFRFPVALDGSGKKNRLSGMPASHAQDWLEEVNIIFQPQLNISFKLAGASEPFFNQQIGAVTSNHWGLLKENSNRNEKTITVFVAKSILTEDKDHPWGISLNGKSRVILLQDRDSEDELIKTLAHEFGHTLGDMKGYVVGHPGGPGELMVSLSRFGGVRISADLVSPLGKQ